MNINVPKASVGLGTTGIGDNFARARLMMAKQAGYVQSTPSPYSQPGTALKQYQSAAPVLSAVAKAQGQKGIPGLLRDGIAGRPPMQGAPGRSQSLVNTPAPQFNSTVAGHAVGNPFSQMGQPQMPLNWFNRPGANQLNSRQPVPGGPYRPPTTVIVGRKGGSPNPIPGSGLGPRPEGLNGGNGGRLGPVSLPPAAPLPGGAQNPTPILTPIYPPGTIANFTALPQFLFPGLVR